MHELTFPKGLRAPDDRYSTQVEGFLRIVGASNSKKAQALRTKLSKIQLLGTDRRWTWGKVTYRPVDLDQLAGLPVKHLEVLNARGVPCTIELEHVTHCELIDCHLDALPAMPELTMLVIRDGKLPRLDVSRFPKLQSLSVQGVQDLRGIEGVSGLPLTDVSLAGLPATPDLTGVKTLKRLDLSVGKADTVRFESRGLQELSLTLPGSVPLPQLQCTELKSLSLSGSAATDLSALSGVAVVSSLSLQDMDHVTSLDGLIDYGTLHVRNLPKLVRVRGGRHITRLSLQSCESLVDLDGLGPCPKLNRFDGWNCAALT
ncbi:MAG: hypothetical protein GY913_12085 [Proteobacteria bacterium]|nr:hypothetical protein [Pseudomonadota bacterium]MCP4917655.1 hypothetical protein [Pseudomonadota bacterium]